jgi:hypothetical protein
MLQHAVCVDMFGEHDMFDRSGGTSEATNDSKCEIA